MPAPTYTWEFNSDLMGDRVPKIANLKCSSGLYTKVGTLLIMSSGLVDEAGASVVAAVGLAAEEISNAAEGDSIKVELIAPGFIYKGTADADADALSGFANKTVDFNTDGSLDVADTSAGSFSVLRTENAGLTVYGLFTVGATF